MIATLTPNPCFDQTLVVAELIPGQFHRSTSSSIEAGGKGINVSRVLATAGVATRCIFPAAAEAEQLSSLVQVDGAIEIIVVDSSRALRHNVTIVDSEGDTTKVNERGETPSEEDLEALLQAAQAGAADCDWFVMGGSLPFGVDPGFYGRVYEAVQGQGSKFAADTSGPALASAVSAGCTLIKPNTEELAELVGRKIVTLGDAVEAAKWAIDAGVSQVLLTMGSDGALLVNDELTAHATAPPTVVRNTVGAGDASLAGFLYGGGAGEAALAAAVAWGRAAVATPGTSVEAPSSEDHALVTVAPPNHDYKLEDS